MDIWGRAVQVEGTASAKALRQEHSSHVGGQQGDQCAWSRVT